MVNTDKLFFEDRVEAGKRLAARLTIYQNQNCLVVALPRGGVPVGFEVAKFLTCPLNVLVVKKLSTPINPELAIGAITLGDIEILNHQLIQAAGINSKLLNLLRTNAKAELKRQSILYQAQAKQANLQEKTVIIVDDGLATGSTMSAAVKFFQAKKVENIVVALPVCDQQSVMWLSQKTGLKLEKIVCVFSPTELSAVSTWYKQFEQVTDQQVIKLLKKANQNYAP